MKLPADSLIASEKLTGYLLRWRPENDKSAFLALAGYTLENAAQLRKDVQTQLLSLDAEFLELTEYGTKYEIRGCLRGPNGQELQVVTIWMIEETSQQAKFITLYPARR
jgi:hypothetical protein